MNEYVPEYPHIPEEIDDTVFEEDYPEVYIDRPVCTNCSKRFVPSEDGQVKCRFCLNHPEVTYETLIKVKL